MPADRTKAVTSMYSDDVSIWSPSSESIPSGGISFAPNLTPGTFTDPPPLVEVPSCESLLFPPAEACPTTRRPGHGKKKPENHIPRPPNAFILFRSSFIKSQHVSNGVETNHSTLSKIIGLTWQNLPNEERQLWHAKAKIAHEEHKRKYPQYAFRPLHGKNKGIEKRKVREVGPKDLKRCEKIAELLVQGKKGRELDAAIQEFDKHHVPEVITRFEAPVTADEFGTSLGSRTTKVPKRKGSSQESQTGRSTPSMAEASPTPEPYFATSQGQMHELTAEPYIHMDHFESYAPKPASFDFSSFHFDNVAQTTAGSFEATRDEDLSSMVLLPPTNDCRPPQLSIDTSFLDAEGWVRGASPISATTCSMPPTPSHLDSPSPNFYEQYAVDPFPHHTELNITRSPFQGPTTPVMYSPHANSTFNGNEISYESPAMPGFLYSHEPKASASEGRFDYAQYMSNLSTQYSL